MNRIFGLLFCVLLLALPSVVCADDALKQELAKLKSDRALRALQFDEDHPTIDTLNRKIQLLEKGLEKSAPNKNGLRSIDVGDLDAPEVAKMLTNLFEFDRLAFTGSNSTGEIYYWWTTDEYEKTIEEFVLRMRQSQRSQTEEQQVGEKHKAGDESSQTLDVTTKQTRSITFQQLKELQDKYAMAERNVTKLAREIASSEKTDPAKRGELAKLVQQAFDLRQKLQLAQVASGRARLDAIEQRIQTRTNVQSQMVARRVEELIAKSGTLDAKNFDDVQAAEFGQHSMSESSPESASETKNNFDSWQGQIDKALRNGKDVPVHVVTAANVKLSVPRKFSLNAQTKIPIRAQIKDVDGKLEYRFVAIEIGELSDAARAYFAENKFVLSLSATDLLPLDVLSGERRRKAGPVKHYYERYYCLVPKVPDLNGKLSLREYSTQDAVSMRSLPQEGVVVKVQIGDQLPQSIKRAPGVNLLAATKPSGSTFSIEVIWKYGISSDVSAEKATYLSGILVGTVRDKAIIATVFPPDLSDDTESIKSIFISQRGLQRRARIVVERHPENVFLLECDLPGYPYGLVGPQLALHQQIAFRDKSPGSAMRSQDPRYLTTEESNNLLCGEPVFQTQSNQLIAIMGMRPSSDRESIGELKSDGTLIPVATIRDLLHSYMQSQVSGKAVYSEMHGGRIGLIPKETYGEWLIGGQAFVVSRKTSLERESRMVFPDKKVRPDAFKVGVVVDVEYHTQNGIQYADEIEIQKK